MASRLQNQSPKETSTRFHLHTFKSSKTLVELAKRVNGLKWDREGFELDLEIGKGGIWLRLSGEQYVALGGALELRPFRQAKRFAL